MQLPICRYQVVQWCCHSLCWFLHSFLGITWSARAVLLNRRMPTLDKLRSAWQQNVWRVIAHQTWQNHCWNFTARPLTNLLQMDKQLIQVCHPLRVRLCISRPLHLPHDQGKRQQQQQHATAGSAAFSRCLNRPCNSGQHIATRTTSAVPAQRCTSAGVSLMLSAPHFVSCILLVCRALA
jgi:hypothetical protein